MEGMKGKKRNCRGGVQRGHKRNRRRSPHQGETVRTERPVFFLCSTRRDAGFVSGCCWGDARGERWTEDACGGRWPGGAGLGTPAGSAGLGTPAGGAGLGPPASRTDVPHVEVDHVLGVGPLDRDGEGLEGVEGEGHQASDCMVHGTAQKACLDLKLQKAGVPSVKPVRETKERQ